MDKAKQAVYSLLEGESTIVVSRPLAHAIGLNEALVFQSMLRKYRYYANHNQLTDDGYFFTTCEDLEESTTLGRRAQERAIKRLIDLGLISQNNRGLPLKRHFYINFDADIEALILKDSEIKDSREALFPNSLDEKDKLGWIKGTSLNGQKGQLNEQDKTNKNKTINQSKGDINSQLKQEDGLIDLSDRKQEAIRLTKGLMTNKQAEALLSRVVSEGRDFAYFKWLVMHVAEKKPQKVYEYALKVLTNDDSGPSRQQSASPTAVIAAAQSGASSIRGDRYLNLI